MMKTNWKTKLSSRKFWAMLGGQITAILTAFNAGESVMLQISAVIASIGMFAVYILSEAHVDGKREEIAIIEIDGSVDIEDSREPLI